MKKILLTQGQFALVNDEDFADLSRFKWHAWYCYKTRSFYARRVILLPDGRKGCEYMHRRILGLSPGDGIQGDHKNRDTLDNQRSNLRKVTHQQNQQNKTRTSKHGIGIHFDKRCKSKPFSAHAQVDGGNHYVGMFATAKEAQKARARFLRRTQAVSSCSDGKM